MNYFLLVIFFHFINFNCGERSKLVQIACSRNPTLSFCGEDKAAEEKKLEGLVQPLPNLPTFQEELIRSLENSTVKIEEKSIEEVEETLDISSKNETSEASEAPEDFEDEGIPDDPILEEPIPGSNSSELGSLLRLPNPKKSKQKSQEPESQESLESGLESKNSSESEPESKTPSESELVTPPPLPRTVAPGVPEPSISKAEVVDVFVTKFCVDNRKKFIVKCRRSAVDQEDLEFCKSYPSNCQSNQPGVLPLLAYCEQFLENYVKICNPNVKRNKKGREFCKAYDQFCVPPPTPEDLLKSTQDLVKCDEIVAEARKVCNPFPQPSDRLNHLRCTQFFKFCGKFVDWL